MKISLWFVVRLKSSPIEAAEVFGSRHKLGGKVVGVPVIRLVVSVASSLLGLVWLSPHPTDSPVDPHPISAHNPSYIVACVIVQ